MSRLGKPVSQRQLRVGEMIKQALGMIFIRDEAKLPNLATKEAKKLAEQEKISISSYNIIYEVLDFIKNKMSGLLSPDVEEQIIGSAEILEIFKVSKVGKVAGSKVRWRNNK